MYMCLHTYMCTYTTYMYAHMHSQPNLISEIHAIKRSFLKKTGYMQTSEKGHLNLSSGCHMHGLKHAWAHTHMYACLRLHRYTQESFRRNAFWKQQWPRPMKTVSFLQERRKMLGPFHYTPEQSLAFWVCWLHSYGQREAVGKLYTEEQHESHPQSRLLLILRNMDWEARD